MGPYGPNCLEKSSLMAFIFSSLWVNGGWLFDPHRVSKVLSGKGEPCTKLTTLNHALVHWWTVLAWNLVQPMIAISHTVAAQH